MAVDTRDAFKRIDFNPNWNAARDAGLALVSAILLVVSFPIWDAGFFAWVALVPFFVAVSGRGFAGAVLLAVFLESIFIPGIFSWILELWYYRWYHHALLAVYFGIYFGLFGLATSFLSKRLGPFASLWSTPFLWVALEYLRSNFLFLSLPWGLLAHTQYRYPAAIQMVSIFGTYGLSFMIVFFNAALAVLILMLLKGEGRDKQQSNSFHKKGNCFLAATACSCFFLMLAYGVLEIRKPIAGEQLEIAAIQGNIPQEKKWDPNYAEEIMRVYSDLTIRASEAKPDLVIWPETATPGSVADNKEIFRHLKSLVSKTGVPLVLGSAQYQKFQEAETTKIGRANSAYLIFPEEKKGYFQRYDKIRLFPFGEYLPYEKILPWKWIHVSSLGDYLPGNEYTLFELLPHRFAVTICWENIFPDLVRQFVKRGAQFVVNITNEARFGTTAAPYQLMAISVFRAVENRVFVIRCANTGVSCIIDPYGRIARRLQDKEGRDLFIRGFLKEKIVSTDSKTFYTIYGDMAHIIAFTGYAIFMIAALRKSEKAKNGRELL